MKYIEPIKMDDINLNDKDFLQTKVYSDQLQVVLDNYYKSKTKDPLYIGLIGEWGSGKSTIVKSAISNIKNIKLFEYDAWKYEDDSFRRTFIKKMLEQSDIKKFSDDYDKINSSLYEDYSISSNSILDRIKLSKAKDKKFNTWKDYLIALLFVFLVIALGFIIMDNYKSVLGMLFSLLGSIGFFNILYSETTYSKSKLFSPEQFYSAFKKILKKSKGKNNLIFIDNLDRCDGENLVLTLKCIRGFYVDKKEKFNEKLVFIIPLDGNSLNSAYNVNDSNHYIDKIFDSIIYLKQITVTDKMDFINQLLDENSEIKSIFPQSVREVLVCSNIKTPREIIKMINDYVMQYQIFVRNKGDKFFENIKNKEYLMKSVILNKKYNSFYQLAFENMSLLIEYEKNFIDPQKEFDDEFGVECRKFLEITTNIVPVDYYDFYNNQNRKPYSLPDDIEKLFDSCNIDLIKESCEKQKIIKHLSNGIHYYINNSMWKIKIANRFKLFVILTNNNFFSQNEINEVITSWNNSLFNSSRFYREVVYNKIISFEELVKFINNSHPSNKFVEKMFEGIDGKIFSDNEEKNYEYYAELYNNNLIVINSEKDKERINKHVSEVCNKGLFENTKYLDFVNSTLIKYITLENLKLIISKFNHTHADRVCSMIDSIRSNEIIYDSDFMNTLIVYLNENCPNIKDYNQLEKIFTFIIEQEQSTDYMNLLSLNFSFEEIENLHSIDDIICKYISNNLYNDTIRNFVYYFKIDSNIDSVFNGFDRSINKMNQDFLNCYSKYITEVDIKSFKRNIKKVVKIYDKTDNKLELLLNFKNRKILRDVYDSIRTSSNKESFIVNALNMPINFEEQVDNIFLYESDPDRFKRFIDGVFSLSNALIIVKKIEKKSNVNICVDKIASLIKDKDNILQNEFESILEILTMQYIDKNNSKKIIKCILDKVDTDCIRRINDSVDITDEKVKSIIEEKLSEKELQTVQ